MNEIKSDQAKLLREQMDQINHDAVDFDKPETVIEDEDINEIDVLNLPPRSEIHDEKETKFQYKISIAFVRLFAILFLIIVILILTYSYWGDYFFADYQSTSLRADQVGESVHIVSVTETLSEEITKKVFLDQKDKQATFMTGRYYLTQKGDTLASIIEHYYDSDKVLPLIQTVNDLSISKDIILTENSRLFLPSEIHVNSEMNTK